MGSSAGRAEHLKQILKSIFAESRFFQPINITLYLLQTFKITIIKKKTNYYTGLLET